MRAAKVGFQYECANMRAPFCTRPRAHAPTLTHTRTAYALTHLQTLRLTHARTHARMCVMHACLHACLYAWPHAWPHACLHALAALIRGMCFGAGGPSSRVGLSVKLAARAFVIHAGVCLCRPFCLLGFHHSLSARVFLSLFFSHSTVASGVLFF